MCGIAGIKRLGDKPIPEARVKSLLLGLEHRGKDATGIAIKKKNDVYIHKKPETAWQVVSSQPFDDFLDKHLPNADVVLLHTRAATLGSPYKSENNHPITAGRGVVTHNGMISNHESLFTQFHMERTAEVDSDVIRAIVDRNGFEKKPLVADLNALRGSAAFAALHPDWPDHLLFGRSGNPLVFCFDPGFLMWASEKHALHAALRPWQQQMGIWFRASAVNAGFAVMPTDTLWLLGPKGLEWHEPFKSSVGNYYPITYTVKKGKKSCSYIY